MDNKFRNVIEFISLPLRQSTSTVASKKMHPLTSRRLTVVSDGRTVLLSTFIILFLLSSSVSLSNFYLAVPMRGCFGKHSCMSSPFHISILSLNGTCSLRELILFCGDVPTIKTKLNNNCHPVPASYMPARQHRLRNRVDSVMESSLQEIIRSKNVALINLKLHLCKMTINYNKSNFRKFNCSAIVH